VKVKMRKLLLLAAAGLVIIAGAIVAWFAVKDGGILPERPQIAFAPLVDDSISDPDNPTKVFHVDFARVEREFPLSRADLLKLTPENLKTLEQEEIDQIYGRLTAGPIPDGFYRGDLFFRRSAGGGPNDDPRTRLGEIIGALGGDVADAKLVNLEELGRKIWLGKRFYRDERVLRNVIEDLVALRPILEDESSIEQISVPRKGWLSYILPTTEAWLLFPAKLYCGQSLLDGRRESTIIDYAYTDEIPGYRPQPDSLAGRGGLRIRDEIRMIRPGFYLGRAYANRMFLLNFTLYQPETAENGRKAFEEGGETPEDCWPGEQGRASAE
jgi:hypothetical protein